MRLPINIIPNTNPPIFRWKQVVSTISGSQVIHHEGALPVAVEVAIARLIGIAKQLMFDNAALQGQIQGMADRIASQSELLSKKAEKTEAVTVQTSTAQVSSLKKK